MKQKIRTLVATVLSACLLAACDKPSQKAEQSQSAVEKNQVSINQPLNVVAPWEITSVDPSKSGYIFQRLQLAETLVDADEKGNLLPALAVSWQSNATADEWTFTLRENVKFHDGSILTAENVVQSLTAALAKPSPLKSVSIKKITALSANQVQISLEKPLVSLPAYFAHSTTIILAKSAFDTDNNVQAIIGTGAYKADKIEPPQKIEQTAFTDYWGEKAKITQVTYLANSRSETRTLLAQSNANYLVFNLDPASLARLKQDPNLVLASKSIARTIQYKVNAKHPLFENVEVRQALSDAIDRAGIAQSVLRIENGIADQLVPEAFADWRVATEYKQPDYAAIKARLVALGFTTDEQGMLHQNGQPFKFTLRTFSDRPELPIIATALQNQWKQIGVDVVVSVGNFSEIPAGHQDGSLEMALYARNYGLVPDLMGALLQDFAPQGGDWGVMNWSNADLTDALARLQNPLKSEEQQQLKQQVAQIIYQQRPITPVVFYQQNAAANKALKGLDLDAFERSFKLNQLSW